MSLGRPFLGLAQWDGLSPQETSPWAAETCWPPNHCPGPLYLLTCWGSRLRGSLRHCSSGRCWALGLCSHPLTLLDLLPDLAMTTMNQTGVVSD